MPIPTNKTQRKASDARAKAKQQVQKNVKAEAERAQDRESAKARKSPKLSRPLDGPRIEGDETYFSRGDRLELLYVQEQLLHSETMVRRAKAEITAIEASYRLQRDAKAAEHATAILSQIRFKGALDALHRDIEMVYGKPMKSMVFDDVTGLIKKVDVKEKKDGRT